MQAAPPFQPSHRLVFVRHGATKPNLAGLRCGGDLDVSLTDLGRRQAVEAAQRIQRLGLPVGVIVCSDLRRTRESAQIIGQVLAGADVIVDPSFAERRLGSWNLCKVADTEAGLVQGVTPPDGESNQAFMDRISGAMERLLPHLPQSPLLVGSKGVARALAELLGLPGRLAAANGELVQFNLAPLLRREDMGCPT
jgi:probable phosphoglycerate mutase